VEPSSIQQQVLRREKTLTDAVDDFEREIIQAALLHVNYNQTPPPTCSARRVAFSVPDGQARDSADRLKLYAQPVVRRPQERVQIWTCAVPRNLPSFHDPTSAFV